MTVIDPHASQRPMVPLRQDLLDSFDASIGDVADAESLPPEMYTSADVYEFEKDAIFAKEWLCVGRASAIPEPGDWFTRTICDEPIVVTRDKQGEINAMSPVCQHRGMQVVEGCGHNTTLKCPYHHWNYALDGRLLGAPTMHKTHDFDKSLYGLPKFKVEVWQGFIFVNLDADAAPLAPTLSVYEPYLKNYDLTNAVDPSPELLKRDWNWKVMVENFNDGYHATKLHQYVQDFAPSENSAFPGEWNEDMNVIFRTASFTHPDAGFNATHRAIMPIFPNLTDEERMFATFAMLPPTLGIGTSPDNAFYFIWYPTGPETIDLHVGSLFDPSTMEDPLFEHKKVLSDAGIQVFIDQDTDATTKVQQGLRSRFAARGRYAYLEEPQVRFNRWLVKRYRAAMGVS